jgi:hypothetical protein
VNLVIVPLMRSVINGLTELCRTDRHRQRKFRVPRRDLRRQPPAVVQWDNPNMPWTWTRSSKPSSPTDAKGRANVNRPGDRGSFMQPIGLYFRVMSDAGWNSWLINFQSKSATCWRSTTISRWPLADVWDRPRRDRWWHDFHNRR